MRDGMRGCRGMRRRVLCGRGTGLEAGGVAGAWRPDCELARGDPSRAVFRACKGSQKRGFVEIRGEPREDG